MNDIPRPNEMDPETETAFWEHCDREGVGREFEDDWFAWWVCWYDGYIHGQNP